MLLAASGRSVGGRLTTSGQTRNRRASPSAPRVGPARRARSHSSILSRRCGLMRTQERTPGASFAACSGADGVSSRPDRAGHLDSEAAFGFTSHVRFYGLLDHDLREAIEFYPSREAVEAELAEILGDEPGWVTKLEIVQVDLGGAGSPSTASLGPPCREDRRGGCSGLRGGARLRPIDARSASWVAALAAPAAPMVRRRTHTGRRPGRGRWHTSAGRPSCARAAQQ
jgi:hypothetical protein